MKKSLNIGYKVLAIGLITYALLYGLLASLPSMGTLQQSARNLFYHVPMWFTEVVLMSISVYYSIRYLRMTDPDAPRAGDPLIADVKASEAARLGVVFNALGLITGILWGRVSWGQTLPDSDFSAWWVWDPIQTCALIAMLIYLGYFLLRSSFAEPEQKARIAAVFNIFAFAALIPLFFVIPRMLQGLHPTAEGENTGLFDTQNVTNIYRLVLYPAALGFILLGIWLFELRSRAEMLQLRLSNLIADQEYEQS
jgi:heme exporter protein C